MHVHVRDVYRELLVVFAGGLVEDEEEQVETREERVGKGNIFVGILVDVILE